MLKKTLIVTTCCIGLVGCGGLQHFWGEQTASDKQAAQLPIPTSQVTRPAELSSSPPTNGAIYSPYSTHTAPSIEQPRLQSPNTGGYHPYYMGAPTGHGAASAPAENHAEQETASSNQTYPNKRYRLSAPPPANFGAYGEGGSDKANKNDVSQFEQEVLSRPKTEAKPKLQSYHVEMQTNDKNNRGWIAREKSDLSKKKVVPFQQKKPIKPDDRSAKQNLAPPAVGQQPQPKKSPLKIKPAPTTTEI